jgi:putative membrane protein
MLVSSLLVAIGMYAVGVTRLWRSAGYGRGVRPFEVLAFTAGCAAVGIALSPPLDEWSEQWLTAHMVQHELLMVVAAPLVAVGAPLVGMLWAMPLRLRRAIVGTVQHTPLPPVCQTMTAPAVAFMLYGLALWIWHMPALYDAALQHELVHIVSTSVSLAPRRSSGGGSCTGARGASVTGLQSSTSS